MGIFASGLWCAFVPNFAPLQVPVLSFSVRVNMVHWPRLLRDIFKFESGARAAASGSLSETALLRTDRRPGRYPGC
jgi:hypothetical protein